jgi:hypothetical protein
MARVFAITATPEALTLDAKGRGELSFSVTNTSARPLRARARLVPLGAAQAAWFTAPPEPEQTLAAGATHAYSVRVSVPAGTSPGPTRTSPKAPRWLSPCRRLSPRPRAPRSLGGCS